MAQIHLSLAEGDDGLSIPDMPDMQPISAPITGTGAKPVSPPQPQPRREDGEARCYALMGASGGVGTTTLAIQMAYDLAINHAKKADTQQPDPKVCLIDLDFENGACSTYLDLPPSLQIADLCGAPDQIDPALTHALISTHSSGLAVLSVPNELGGNARVNPEAVLALLDAASQIYDHIVIDVPRLWRPWTQAAIAGADHFALVTELTVPGLHLARQRLRAIEAQLTLPSPAEVILGRVERRSFRNALRLSDAEKALERPLSGVICTDPDTAREAVNCGEPMGVIAGESRYVKDVRAISAVWMHDTVAVAEPKRSFWGRKRRRA